MTHIYKTVTSINQKFNQNSPNKIKEINTNLNIDEIPENTTQILNKEKTLGDSEEIKGNFEEKINSGFEEGKKSILILIYYLKDLKMNKNWKNIWIV